MLPFAFADDAPLPPEPRAVSAEGAAWAIEAPDLALPALVTVGWRAAPVDADLADLVEPEVAAAVGERGGRLVDLEPTEVDGCRAVRTLIVRVEAGDVPTAVEQWRWTGGGRRWVLSVATALVDQPSAGARLAALATGFRRA